MFYIEPILYFLSIIIIIIFFLFITIFFLTTCYVMYVCMYRFNGSLYQVYVRKRPYLDYFLETVTKSFEVRKIALS